MKLSNDELDEILALMERFPGDWGMTVKKSVLASLIQELSELRGETCWKPIETAPKDGRRVYLGWAGLQDFDVIAHWTCGDWALSGTGDCAERLHGRSKPTHWRPLPPAP